MAQVMIVDRIDRRHLQLIGDLSNDRHCRLNDVDWDQHERVDAGRVRIECGPECRPAGRRRQ
jgi:hypothetical protein